MTGEKLVLSPVGLVAPYFLIIIFLFRFIPMRCAMDLDTSNYMLTKQNKDHEQTEDDGSQSAAEYERQMRDLLENSNEGQAAGPGKKILRFNQPTPQAIGSMPLGMEGVIYIFYVIMIVIWG